MRESDMLAKPVCPECLEKRRRKVTDPLLLDLIRDTQGEQAVQDYLDAEKKSEDWFDKIPDEVVAQASEGSKDAISAILKEAFESINKP
jgi:arginine utilization protein RocB